MKFLFKIASAVASACAAFAASAQDAPAPSVHYAMRAYQPLDFVSRIARADPGIKIEEMSPDAMAPMSSAPPLQRVAVYAVGSSQYGGWEYMTSLGQASTVGNHGGPVIRVVVQEIGYGNNPVVTYQGGVLPAAKYYQSTPICVVNGYYTSPCPAGYTVVGFYQYFDLDGYATPSEFTYQSTSLNSPWNTLYTRIYIK